ncbi:MAG: hypothetical protein PHN69_04465 [Candidatus Pacebacteria bacterium]|nr:hypothetical protein [Fermentimonas sp.]MDD4804407.1 hypothetical protein [Candidatus Paceibacterota bacterium]
MDDMIYKTSIGQKITHVIADMHAVAIANDCTVRTMFNDYELIVTPKDDPTELLHKFTVEMAVREVEYRKSPEYRKHQEELNQRKSIQKNKLNQLCAHYPDFNNIDAVVEWLEKLSECDLISLKDSGIVSMFEVHGYFPGVNTYENFNANDKDNFGRWLIGQALGCIEDFGGIHPIFNDHAKQWRERFGVY